MARYLGVTVLALAIGSRAWAGGPPPVYVVVDKVILEPNPDAPERIRIEGCFVRQEEEKLQPELRDGHFKYQKPVEGYVYMSIDPGKEKECRAEWAKWQKAAGTGKVVSVGWCVDAGSFLTVKIHKLDEKTERPDVVYKTNYEGVGGLYANWELEELERFADSPVTGLLAFAKARQKTNTEKK